MRYLPGIFSLLVGVSGWFYLFYSRAVHRLGGIEEEHANRLRLILRRAGGLVMLLLGGFFYAGFYAVDAQTSATAFIVVWLTVFGLLMLIVLLALMDVRLTARLRRRRR